MRGKERCSTDLLRTSFPVWGKKALRTPDGANRAGAGTTPEESLRWQLPSRFAKLHEVMSFSYSRTISKWPQKSKPNLQSVYILFPISTCLLLPMTMSACGMSLTFFFCLARKVIGQAFGSYRPRTTMIFTNPNFATQER